MLALPYTLPNTDQAFRWLQTWDQTLAAVGSLLTFAIILIYIRQSRLLREQADAMQAGYTPLLLVHSVDIVDAVEYADLPYSPSNIDPPTESSSASADGEGTIPGSSDSANHSESTTAMSDFVKLEVSNVGNEVSCDIQLHGLVTDVDSGLLCKDRLLPAAVPLRRTANPYQISDSDGGVLATGERSVELVGRASLTVADGEPTDNPKPFRNCMISDLAGDRIEFGLSISYRNSIGKKYCVPLGVAFRFTVPNGDEAEEIESLSHIYEEAKRSESNFANAELCDMDRLTDGKPGC